MNVTLIRHTALQVPQGICYGQSDVDVAATFFAEVETLKSKLANMQFDAIYSSPLQRCTKLADALQGTLNMASYGVHPNLSELHFGDWEMQAWDDIPRDVFDEWAHNYAHIAPPNGETFSQMQQRVLDFLAEAQLQHAGQEIAIVTHGGVIRALIAHVLNMPLKGLFRFHIDHGGISRLEFGDAVPRVNFVNR
jgi:alpha-ribazole phosphatase